MAEGRGGGGIRHASLFLGFVEFMRFLQIMLYWSRCWDSNPVPLTYQVSALPGELQRHTGYILPH